MKTPLLQMIKAEPGLKDWQERIIDGVRDLPDREGYVDSQVVPIVEYVLCRDPVAFFCVARTEEAILADVRERLAAMKDDAKEREALRLRRDAAQGLTLTPSELRNLLMVSWRDGNLFPERHHDEWPETMHANVTQTMAEIDRWKAEGIPEGALCDCGRLDSDCRNDHGATEAECPTYGA